ncbi:MAG: hypothetical protein KA978_11615 [Deltaproteobacteria bacterium]|jgi:hypothetical protein|nr:hypothetical protein [Deltaproteobacteria bacterium]
MWSNRRWLPVSLALLLPACGGDESPFDSMPEEDSGVMLKEDAGPIPTFPDLGVTDRGFPEDQGFPRVDVPEFDSGAGFDSGTGFDAGFRDTGIRDTGIRDTGIRDTGIRDTGIRDTGPADTGPAYDPCAMGSVIDLNMAGTLAGTTTSYTGSNTMVGGTAPLRPACGSATSIGHEVVLRYTPRATSRLRVSTNNDGTTAGFDTVAWAQPACSSLPTGNAGLGCNDDSGTAPRTLASTFTTSANVTAGTAVYIVVAGYRPSGTPTGTFALTVTELVPGMAGAMCDPRVSSPPPCADALTCIADAGSTTTGTCIADGSAGGRCRATGTACDMGLACSGSATSTASRCRAAVAVGAACDPARVTSLCATGSTCVTANGSSTCVADGARGGTCRVVAPRCDSMLTCSTMTGSGVCREVVADGASCDPAGTNSVCQTGRTCAAFYGAATGTCVVDGNDGARCRTSGAACETGLICSGTASATTSRCRTRVELGAACDPVGERNLCATNSGCVSSPVGWTCVALGSRGGICRPSGTRCDSGLTCISGTPNDYCRERLSSAGAMCDAANQATLCATNSSCLATAGQTVGACTANGTAAGADCRTSGTRCDSGLACTTTSGAGWCRRASTAAMACDWTGRVTSCPAMTACAPSSATAGTCAMQVMETEPNNSITAPSPTVTASTVFAGSVEAGGRDCVGVDLPMGASIFADVQLPATPTCAPGGPDPFLTVFNPMGRLISFEDDSVGRGRCAVIDPTVRPELARLAAGRYVVCVNGYNNAAVPNYLFTVGVVR